VPDIPAVVDIPEVPDIPAVVEPDIPAVVDIPEAVRTPPHLAVHNTQEALRTPVEAVHIQAVVPVRTALPTVDIADTRVED
jgi:hypothetical protein